MTNFDIFTIIVDDDTGIGAEDDNSGASKLRCTMPGECNTPRVACIRTRPLEHIENPIRIVDACKSVRAEAVLIRLHP